MFVHSAGVRNRRYGRRPAATRTLGETNPEAPIVARSRHWGCAMLVDGSTSLPATGRRLTGTTPTSKACDMAESPQSLDEGDGPLRFPRPNRHLRPSKRRIPAAPTRLAAQQ